MLIFIKHFFAQCLLAQSLCFLSLAPYALVSHDEQSPLTRSSGNAEKGKRLILDSEKGNCLLCHQINPINDQFQGTIGPNLSTIGSRLSPAQLRFRIVDASRLFPKTIMPSYFKKEGLRQVANDYQNQTILNAQEIEDIVAYLSQLKLDQRQTTQSSSTQSPSTQSSNDSP